jgi:hypothetical protein
MPLSTAPRAWLGSQRGVVRFPLTMYHSPNSMKCHVGTGLKCACHVYATGAGAKYARAHDRGGESLLGPAADSWLMRTVGPGLHPLNYTRSPLNPTPHTPAVGAPGVGLECMVGPVCLVLLLHSITPPICEHCCKAQGTWGWGCGKCLEGLLKVKWRTACRCCCCGCCCCC